MRSFSLFVAIAFICLAVAGVGYRLNRDNDLNLNAHASYSLPTAPLSPETRQYVLDASKSSFIAHAQAGGLLWFKGHDHLIAVREFTGEAQLTPGSITPAMLRISAKSASMVETSDVFTEPQKEIINKELRDIVLLPERYPEINFLSTSVTGKATAANNYDLKITGDLTLLGVTRQITIPTQVTINGNEMRARGAFSVDRGDFHVKATSAMHGLIRVKGEVEFTFDIVGHMN